MGSAFQRRSGARTRVCGPSNVSASFSVARLHIAPTRSGTKRQDSEDGDSKWREASVFAVWWQHALDHILKIWQLYVLSVFALGWSPDRSPIAGREKTRNRIAVLWREHQGKTSCPSSLVAMLSHWLFIVGSSLRPLTCPDYSPPQLLDGPTGSASRFLEDTACRF